MIGCWAVVLRMLERLGMLHWGTPRTSGWLAGSRQRFQMYDNCYPHTTYNPMLYDLRHFDLFSSKFVRLFSRYIRHFRYIVDFLIYCIIFIILFS